MLLALSDVTKSFPTPVGTPLRVLDGVTFGVDRGELVSIIGPSGCGKTTLLRIIAGLEPLDSGRISCGEEAGAPSRIPIVWQEHRLLPWRTVDGNIRLGLEIERCNKEEACQRVETLAKLMGLETFLRYYPSQLSGGMAQRVAIARAMAVKPSVLLMDEPFASVDYQTKKALVKEIQRIRAETGQTIVYVTHDVRDAITISSRVVVLSSLPAKVVEIIETRNAPVPSSPIEERIWLLLAPAPPVQQE